MTANEMPDRIWLGAASDDGEPGVSVEEALRELLQAVCGETGFVACVRRDSGRAYPWPALDVAEEKARAALRALKGSE